MLLGVRRVARAVVGRQRSIGYVGGGDGETVTPAEELVYVPGRHLVAQHCDVVARHESIIEPRSGCLRAVQAGAKRKKKLGGG